MQQIMTDQTTTGQSSAFNVGDLKGDRKGAGSNLTIIVNGITTGTVQIQVGPTSSGPWLTPTDGEITANTVYNTALSQKSYIRLNVTVATSVDIDAWAG